MMQPQKFIDIKVLVDNKGTVVQLRDLVPYSYS